MLNELYVSTRTVLRTPLNILLNRVDPPVIVLIYHRVTTLSSDPEMLAVTPDIFRQQMQYLKDSVSLVRFDEDWSKAAKPAVCITFDDGYADNVLEALPILDEIGVPATFFVSTGIINTANVFWWHELERIILGEGNFLSQFILDDDRNGKCWATSTESERRELYHDLVRLMKDTNYQRREDWLSQLRRWTNCEQESPGIHRGMSVEELRALAASKWATIGAHTVTHSRLSALTPEAQYEEIAASKQQLETWLDRKVEVFSYPFGKRSDYTKKSSALCRDAGFTKAAANFPGQVHNWTDPFRIPRNLVRNWPMETFIENIRGFWTR